MSLDYWHLYTALLTPNDALCLLHALVATGVVSRLKAPRSCRIWSPLVLMLAVPVETRTKIPTPLYAFECGLVFLLPLK